MSDCRWYYFSYNLEFFNIGQGVYFFIASFQQGFEELFSCLGEVNYCATLYCSDYLLRQPVMWLLGMHAGELSGLVGIGRGGRYRYTIFLVGW